MNIVLIGFMGAGKSAVGRLLAAELKMSFLDTDELIEKTAGMTINEIFAGKGEPYFRQLETQVIETLEDYDNFVISAGGGVVLREENVKMLKEIGPLILLWAGPDTVYERIKAEQHRPLLNVSDPKAEIKKILSVREPIYRQAADHVVDTSTLGPAEAAKEIILWLKSKSN